MTMPIPSHLSWERYPRPAALPPVVVRDPSLPLVSIVTPTYNQGHFIRETIESVLNQDYPNIEYWVIDGGSSDETLTILREYEDDPRFHWISERDRGQSDAINKGWSRCRGEIVAWLNSDDVYLHNHVVSSQQRLLGAAMDAALVYADCVFTDEQGNAIGRFPARPFSYFTFLRACHIPQPSVFLTRKLLELVGCINVALKYGMDYDYWLRCARYCEFQYNRDTVVTSRLHESSKTVSQSIEFAYETGALIAAALADLQGRLNQRAQRQIYAGIFLAIGVAYARNGRLRNAARCARRGMRFSPIDPRLLMIVIATLDYLSNGKMNLEVKTMDLWARLRPGKRDSGRQVDAWHVGCAQK